MTEKKRKPGRPKKAVSYSIIKAVAFTPDQWRQIEDAAEATGQPPSVFVRACAMSQAQQIEGKKRNRKQVENPWSIKVE